LERLDDKDYISRLDKSKMRDLIGGTPGQFAQAQEVFRKAELDLEGSYSSVAVVGMGGSAIGGDLAGSYLSRDLPVPLAVVRDYEVPAFVSSETLLIAVSYSGNTEETLTALKSARERGSKTICIGSGGALADLAQSNSLPFLAVPPDMPPRCAVAHLTASIALSVSSAFQITGVDEDIEEAAQVLKEMRQDLDPSVSSKKNRAKKIAAKCVHRLPVIYSAAMLTDAVARRWSTQVNENAKSLCHFNALPELDHNEIVGWGLPREVSYGSYVVFLDTGDLSDQLRKRLKVTKEVISQVAETERVTSKGSGRFARLFSLVYLGDYVSFYLAMLNGVDPTPIERIDYLKRKIREED
jgi:glucose/mannose-6-phosphate isomerase